MANIEIPTSRGESDASRDSFNNKIAIAVALVSAFMAVSKIKDDNIVQGMAKAQAETVDFWNEYQARRQRWFGLELAIAQTKATQTMTPELEKKLAEWKKNADTYQSRAEESATGTTLSFDPFPFTTRKPSGRWRDPRRRAVSSETRTPQA